MKKLFTTFMILSAAVITIAAATQQPSKAISLVTGKEIALEKMVPTQRDIETTDAGATISYHIENIVLEPDSLFAGAYKCVISDFGSSFAEGAPALPVRRDIVELPFGCDTATVTVTKASYVDIPCELAPAYPFWVGKAPRFTKELVGEMSPCDFGSQTDVVTVDEFTTRKDHRLANLIVAPCQYSSSEKKIRIYTDVEYTIDYAPVNQEKVNARRVAKAARFAASREAVATAGFGPLYPIDSLRPSIYPPKPEDAVYYPALDDNVGPYVYNYYQIVTTTKYREAAEEFAAYKRQFGYTTHISCRTRWKTEWVKDSIKGYFDNVVKKSQYYDNYYVLILGGHSDVPAMEDDITFVYGNSQTRYDFYTDYYYGCVGDYDTTAKLAGLGRIPVRNLTEAKTVINKIKGYTLNPPSEDRFYRTGAHIANYDGYNHELDGFIYSSEETRTSILSKCPDLDITRLYNARPDAQPEYYGRDWTENKLPEELKKPNYHWNANRDSIANELKKGCFYTLYRGHGDTTFFCDPSLTSSDIKNLFNNGNKLPVFFNITCTTGTFKNPDCFAETLLKQENGGGVGVFAATVATNHYENCALANTILPIPLWDSRNNIFFDNPYDIPSGGGYAQPCELNEMLTKALDTYPSYYTTNQEKYRFFHKTAYHIFGDPSMWMWVGKPREYNDHEVGVYPHYTINGLSKVEVMINLLDERCYVAIEDKETHEVTLEYGNILSYPEFDATRYNMTVYGLNRIPKVISVPDSNGLMISAKKSSLTLSPNPASTSCLIGYHNSIKYLNTYSGTVTITNISTGIQRDKIWVTEHVGRIELDVSKYPNGTYLVTFTPSQGNTSSQLGIATGQLIVRH